jgi:hypothetical protein
MPPNPMSAVRGLFARSARKSLPVRAINVPAEEHRDRAHRLRLDEEAARAQYRRMKSAAVRAALVLALALGIAASTPSPVLAKGGPVKAVITGPGISSPITLRGPDDSSLLDAIVQESGVLTVALCGTCHERLRQPPTEQLGPRYTVTYTMLRLRGAGAAWDKVVQYVYPLAVPQPVAYLPPGQQFWMQATVGGWFVGRGALRLELQRVGVPLSTVSTPSLAPGSSGATVSNDAGVSSMRTLLPLSVALVVIAVLVAVLLAHLRRPPEPKKVATATGSTTR